MAASIWLSNADLGLDVADLPLPELGAESDEGEGLEDVGNPELAVSEVEGDPFDDRVADDLPLEIAIDLSVEPSVLGDDELGVDRDAEDGVAIDDRDTSLLDDRGHAEEGLELVGDDELGIDPIPRETDDGGAEGLDDPGADDVEATFPPLDGAEDDGEDLDVGIELPG